MSWEINVSRILAPGEALACSVPAKPCPSRVLQVFETQTLLVQLLEKWTEPLV